jgi:hypothetical protein
LAIQSFIVDDFFEENAPKKRRGRPPGRKATTPLAEEVMDRPPNLPYSATVRPNNGITPYMEHADYNLSSVNALMGSEAPAGLPRSVFGTSESTQTPPLLLLLHSERMST